MILARVGYAAFFVVSFLLSVYLTFPWAAVKEQAERRATKAMGQRISIERLEPSWLTGFRLTEVRIDQAKSEPLQFDWIWVRASLFSFLRGGYGGQFELPSGGGEVSGSISGTKERISADTKAAEVEMALVPALRSATGVALAGSLGLDLDVDLDFKDPNQNEGNLALRIRGLETLDNAEVKYPVPAITLGDIDWTVPIENGKILVRNQRLEGPAATVIIDGEIVMAAQPMRSLMNLSIRFKPEDSLLKQEPALQLLLNNIRRAKGRDGFYTYQASGTLKRPRFTAQRR